MSKVPEEGGGVAPPLQRRKHVLWITLLFAAVTLIILFFRPNRHETRRSEARSCAISVLGTQVQAVAVALNGEVLEVGRCSNDGCVFARGCQSIPRLRVRAAGRADVDVVYSGEPITLTPERIIGGRVRAGANAMDEVVLELVGAGLSEPRVVSCNASALAQSVFARTYDQCAGRDFTFRNLPSGFYFARARGPGVLSDVYPIELSDPRISLDLELQPAQSARVRVVDANGTPIENARVRLLASGLDPFPLEVATDTQGSAPLSFRPNGDYSLTIERPGYMSYREVMSTEVGLVGVRLETATRYCGHLSNPQGQVELTQIISQPVIQLDQASSGAGLGVTPAVPRIDQLGALSPPLPIDPQAPHAPTIALNERPGNTIQRSILSVPVNPDGTFEFWGPQPQSADSFWVVTQAQRFALRAAITEGQCPGTPPGIVLRLGSAPS